MSTPDIDDCYGWAFPVHEPDRGDSFSATQFGMTLRDYFAAKAMQSLILHPQSDPKVWPAEAYQLADAMLAYRSKA